MAWFVISVVGFFPDLKGRGIRLVPPVKHTSADRMTSDQHPRTGNSALTNRFGGNEISKIDARDFGRIAVFGYPERVATLMRKRDDALD